MGMHDTQEINHGRVCRGVLFWGVCTKVDMHDCIPPSGSVRMSIGPFCRVIAVKKVYTYILTGENELSTIEYCHMADYFTRD